MLIKIVLIVKIFSAISIPIFFIIDLWEKCIRNIQKSGKDLSFLPMKVINFYTSFSKS